MKAAYNITYNIKNEKTLQVEIVDRPEEEQVFRKCSVIKCRPCEQLHN